MYHDPITKTPEIIIKPGLTLIDGYEFEPRRIMVELSDGTRLSLAEVLAYHPRVQYLRKGVWEEV